MVPVWIDVPVLFENILRVLPRTKTIAIVIGSSPNEQFWAREIQERLVPLSPPAVEGLDYAGVCRPAHGVSGDYYDFFELPSGCFAMLLVDVCGKGMPAALLAASLHAAVRACAGVSPTYAW